MELMMRDFDNYYKKTMTEKIGHIKGALRDFTLEDAIRYENSNNWLSRTCTQIFLLLQGKGKFNDKNLLDAINNIHESKLINLAKKCNLMLEGRFEEEQANKDPIQAVEELKLEDKKLECKEKNIIKKLEKQKDGITKLCELFNKCIVDVDQKIAELEKKLKERGKFKVPIKELFNSIPEAKVQQDLRKIKKEMSANSQQTIKLETVAAQTQNPVTKVEREVYLPLVFIEDKLNIKEFITWERIKAIFDKNGYIHSLAYLQKAFSEQIEEEEGLKKVISELDRLPFDCEQIKDDLNHMNDLVSFNQVTKFIKKDDLLSTLRTVSTEPGVAKIISEIKEIRDDFLDEKELLKKYPELKNQTLYVKKSDIIKQNSQIPELKKKLEQFTGNLEEVKFAEQTYAFKLGAENINERKASILLNFLNLSTFFVPKYEYKFENAELGKHKSPQGIVGKWIKATYSMLSNWDKYLVSKKTYERTKLLNPDVEPDITLEADKRKLEDFGSLTNIAEHCLADMILGSFDSHLAQYAIDPVNREFYCFDFARFLLPADVLRHKENETIVLFRSAFLDHPKAQEPLPEELVEKYRSMDLKKLREDIEASGLLGTELDFAGAVSGINKLKKDLLKKEADPEEYRVDTLKLCEKYGIDTTDKKFDECDQALREEIKRKIVEIQEKCFQKIHPRGFENMMKRLEYLQEYLSSDNTPYTAEGAFAAMYPLLQPFVVVLSRFRINPHNFNKDLSLEQVLKFAKESFTKEDLEAMDEERRAAIKKEIRDMKKALKQLKKTENSCTFEEIQTTIAW